MNDNPKKVVVPKFNDMVRFRQETINYSEEFCQSGDHGVAIAIASTGAGNNDGTFTISRVAPGEGKFEGETQVWLKGLEHLGPFNASMFIILE